GRAHRRRRRDPHPPADHRAAMLAGAVRARDLLVPRQLGPVSLAADGGVDRCAQDLPARPRAVRRGLRQPADRADGDRRARDDPDVPAVCDPAALDQPRLRSQRAEIVLSQDNRGNRTWTRSRLPWRIAGPAWRRSLPRSKAAIFARTVSTRSSYSITAIPIR